jgi:hypothetical protein
MPAGRSVIFFRGGGGMFELLVALLSGPVIAIAVRFYSYWHDFDLRREPVFEAYCSRRPLVAAFACEPSRLAEVRAAIARVIGARGEVFNHQGRFPWPSYKLELELEQHGTVLCLFVRRAILKRPREQRPELLGELIRGLRGLESAIERVWLHGHFYSDGRPSRIDRNRVGFSGRFAGPDLRLSNVIGLPEWTG